MPFRSIAKELVAIAAIVSFAAPALAQDLANVDIPFEKHVLDNGLTVLIHEDHTSPQVHVNVYYKVGSRDEVRGKTGFAHLFEHLMFNGSENYDDEYFAPIQEVGGMLNGDTWFDRTRYYQTVPNTALERVLWLESDRMGHLLGAVTQEKLDNQRGVVQNEKRRAENRPYALVSQNMLEGLFPEGHPYRWTTIGSMEDLDAASLEDVHEWFRKYYGAANAIVTVAGDLDPAETLDLVKLHFGDIPAGPPVTRIDDWVPSRDTSTFQVMQDRVANALISRGWAVPGRDHEEATSLWLAGEIIGGDASSRLYKRLVKEEKLAVSASLGLQPFDLASSMWLQIALLPGADADKARRIAAEVIAEFAAEGPTKSELELIRTQITAAQIKGLDSLTGKATLLAESEYYLGSPDAYKTEFAWLERATQESVRAAAARWLGDGFHEVHVVPFGEYAVAASGASRDALPQVDDYPPAVAPKITDLELKNGIKVRFVKREGVPAVHITGRFVVGQYAAAEEKPGAAGIALAVLDKGTKSRSADDIIADLKRTGSSLSVSVGTDESSAYLGTLTSRIDDALDLYADVLRHPSFEESEVALLKERAITGIEQEKTSPSSVAGKFVDTVVYGGHPYGSTPVTADDIRALTRDDLAAAYRHRIRPQDLTIFAVGGIEEQELLDALNRHLGDWKAAPGETAVVDVRNTAVAEQKPRVILFDFPGAQQSNIVAAHAVDAPYGEGDEAFYLANMIYGGTFTSRINANLREDKGWSYGVRSGASMTLGPRVWQISAQVQTDKTGESIAELLSELHALRKDRPFSAEELEDVRNERVRKLPAITATATGILGYLTSIALYGQPDDFIEQRKDMYEAVSLDDLAPALDDRVDDGKFTWFIAGDVEKIENAVRSLELGPVEVWDADGKRLR